MLQTLFQWCPLILQGFGLNLLMSLLAVLFGTAAGALLGVAQVTGGPAARRSAWLCTELFRNAPTLVLLFFCMYLTPFEIHIGSTVIQLPGWVKAVFGLSLSKMAYVSEIVRGALQSIPSTQWEAAEALGFSRRDKLWRVILPQCVKRMLPPWMNTYAVLIMSTPLAAVLGVQEALGMTRSAVSAAGPDMLAPFYLFLLAIFFTYTYPLSAWTAWLERRYHYKT